MKHALVTGATGGLGRTLVPALIAAGWTVRATGRDLTIGATLGTEFVAADLCTAAPAPLLDGVDTVFHLAALSAPWGAVAAFRAINVDATARLLAAARAAGVSRFVHVSTPSIYAEPRDRIGLTERSPPASRFANAYAATKFAAEQAVLAANGDMTTVVIRPRAIIGPHDGVLLPRLLRAVRGGVLPLPRGGGALIELTDARDVAAALIAAADPVVAGGQAFNISGGAPRSVRWVVATVAETLGLPVRIVTVPIGVAMAGAALGEAIARRREPVVTRYAVMTLAYSQTFDLARARAALGWVPSITPERAIAHALDAADA